MSLPAPVARLAAQIVKVLSPELLTEGWRALAEETCNPLTGQCVNASGALWYLLGGSDRGWKWRSIPERVWPEGGPHYFLEHVPTGIVVDLTAGQYSPRVRIPYERSEGRAPATRGRDEEGRALPPKGAREVVRRVMATQSGRSAVRAARAWSEEHLT